MWHTIFSWFVKITGAPVFYLLMRTKVYYENRKAQGLRIKGKAIIVSNHRSIWDVAMMMMTFLGRTLRCVVAEVMYRFGIMRLVLNGLGAIKVDRHAQDFAFIDRCKTILDKGGVVEIYPEARIPDPEEAKPLPFKPSTVYLALESGAPIIPVYTNGCYFKWKRARMIIGTPFDAREYYDDALSEKENIENITKLLRERIIDLGKQLDEKIHEKHN